MVTLKINKRIDNFFFKEDNHFDFLVFFRISIGLLVFLHFLSIWSDFQKLYGKYGIVPWELHNFFVDTNLMTLPKIISFFEKYNVSENSVLLTFKILFTTLCIFLITGFLTRVSALLLLILQIAYIKGGWLYTYGVDVFATMSLFYLVIFPAGHYHSLDNFLFKKRKDINLLPFRRLFQLHISIAYFFSGFTKSLGYNWWNGEAIWKAIHMPYTTNPDINIDYSWLEHHPYLVTFAGLSIIIIEILYPLFIWISQTRKVWLLLTIGMHLGIALTLGLYFFSAIMIIWNITTFYLIPDNKYKTINEVSPEIIIKESIKLNCPNILHET